MVESLEDQMTVYRDDSEVIRINRRAAEEPVAVEPRLFALVQLAERLHRDTEGALDITSGPLSDAWGFSRRRGRLPGDDEIAAALERVGMQHVALDVPKRTITFRRPGVAINLNCMGKGYALDRMAERLEAGGVDDFLFHGGKSSVLARGDQPGKRQGTAGRKQEGTGSSMRPASYWIIGLRHPLRPAERLAEFYLHDQALATSGSATQFFRRHGKSYGHILDPRTGRPAEGVYSATVIAPTAALADGLSTAFYVMGPVAAAKFCARRPELAALLVCPAGREGDVQIHACGLGAGQWRQLG
jgi:thiamine biosynthesis lipoprotein